MSTTERTESLEDLERSYLAKVAEDGFRYASPEWRSHEHQR